MDLCWTDRGSGPVVAVFHGLEGSIHSPYAQGIMQAITVHGWQGVFMHFRGCSGEPNRKDASYHSGDTRDISYLLKILQQRYPEQPLFAIGYSLGGNALLKYLGEIQNTCPLTAAVAISVPFDLAKGADRLNMGFSRFYQWYLIRSLKKKLRKKFKYRTPPINLEQIDTYKNFWLFDHYITAPLHGFESAKDYYKRCSSRQYLKDIKVPTLIIHAKDDPFLPADAIPSEQELSDHVQLELSEQGGHVGFVQGNSPWRPSFWLEQRISEYISSFINGLSSLVK